ncbi:MAG: 4-diphosphocytidyl-2-C-methyl-D-erythritol kinase [Puniceicoccaceae bacterium 5H]|nr:MAG: 4-diphosphocytidyl-2-C-methyl-D-erythritol kinase [Puniceicoccaceae bacterium 5H]
MSSVRWQRRVTCPAKINLGLWVLGQRADSFHALASLVVQTQWGDDLEMTWHAEAGLDRLKCDVPDLPTDERNLIIKACRLFRDRHALEGHAVFRLDKRVPWGGGLGGGSANGAWALRLLNEAHGHPSTPAELHELAAELGSDVPLFLWDAPVWMRGRGEEIEAVEAALAERLRRLAVTIAHPGFPVETLWAYRELAARQAYSSASQVEDAVQHWHQAQLPSLEAFHNDFRAVVDCKYPTIPVVLDALGEVEGIRAQLSGSGSACFAIYEEASRAGAVERVIREAWGNSAFVVHTQMR